MQKGWEVELSNSAIIREGELDWNRVPKRQIVRLTLFYNGRRWDLTNKEDEGASKVCYHVEEATGKFSMEVIDNSGH
jgi:hypothetical protein